VFRFEHSYFFYGLLLLPFFYLTFRWTVRQRTAALARFGDWATVRQLMPTYDADKYTLKFGLGAMVFVCLILAAANPQFGTKKEKVMRKSVDVFVALDISKSMLAQDVLPNRMERAKLFAYKLIEELKGNRIGTIVFAGNAYLQMPLTTDYAAAAVFIKSANPEMAPSQGTAIGEAIAMSMQSFAKDSKTHRALIIISDGEDHDSDAVKKAAEAADADILVYTVGVGSAKGAQIPETSEDGFTKAKIDASGAPILTKINEAALKDIAQAGNGAYFNLADNAQIITTLKKSVDKIEKSEFEARMFSAYDSYFSYFVALALLFLALEAWTDYQQNKWWAAQDIFKV
jgi:Ca-activated chloride channel homolog